ncbi:MAG: hypothetical protein WC875_00475 [Candidatus Absconditabacterales bacterium]
MKLNDFFQEQKNHTLTDVDKLELYQKFLYKRTRNSPIKRFSFVHARSFAYAMVVVMLVFGVYGVYFFNGSIKTPWFSINSNVNVVQADYIAQVVDFDGNFSIEHQGILLQTENIGNGDTILLKKDSAMVFEINSGTKSKIIGPAKLTLQEISEQDAPTKYRINLIYGNFIQMDGNNTFQNVELAVNDILIKQGDRTKPVSYQFINQGGNNILKNNGSNLIITKNGNRNETQVNNKEVLAIQNNDITLYKNWDKFTLAMKKDNVSQTFALNTTDIKTTISDVTTGNTDEMPISLLSLLATENQEITSAETNETISQNLTSLIGEEKKIPTENQTNLLRGLLNENFLLADIQKITNKTEYDATIDKIKNGIQQLCKNFNGKYNAENSLQQNISALITLLQGYEIPPTYTANLNKINTEITRISQIQWPEEPAATENTTE